MRDGEFTVVFQPIVALPSRRPVGAEALLRWDRPRDGSIPPDEFIPEMERSGVIHEVGLWVIERALASVARWNRELGVDPACFVSVNVFGGQLEKEGFAAQVLRRCSAAGVATSALWLEITESPYSIGHATVQRNLLALQESGVRVALDDFGTGCSNLERLDHTDADSLKVDRGFVSRIAAEHGRFPLVESVLDLARALTLSSIAEGVETATQEGWLSLNRCGFAQGHLYSPAIPDREFDAVYRRLVASERS